ncbi:MAG: hypothetical protein HYX35_03745 [Proteobacteria bacterium]|nr:hypothetical protein [Pseudomonadota bacterium]
MKLQFLYAALFLTLTSTAGMAEKQEKLTCTDSSSSACMAAAKAYNTIMAQGTLKSIKTNPAIENLSTVVENSNNLADALAVALSIPIPPENKPSSEKAAAPLPNTPSSKKGN